MSSQASTFSKRALGISREAEGESEEYRGGKTEGAEGAGVEKEFPITRNENALTQGVGREQAVRFWGGIGMWIFKLSSKPSISVFLYQSFYISRFQNKIIGFVETAGIDIVIQS